MKAPIPHVYREPRVPYDWDEINKRFLRILASDIEVEWMFCRLGPLFAVDPPALYGPWHQHVQRR